PYSVGVGVLLPGVVPRRTVVAQVPDAVSVPVRLRRVVEERTVVGAAGGRSAGARGAGRSRHVVAVDVGERRLPGGPVAVSVAQRIDVEDRELGVRARIRE